MGYNMMLIEQIFLVGINEKSNKISFDYKDYLFYGAIIMDLILKEKITVSDNTLKIEILNKDSTDNTILDKMLKLIDINSGKNTLMEVCYEFMKRSNKSEFKEVIISSLEASEFIKYLGKKMFKRRFQLTDPTQRENILGEINAVLIDNQKPTKELMFLLSLLRIESNFKKIIPKKLRKKADKRIREIVKQEFIGNAIQDYIDEMKEELQEAFDDILDDD